MAVLITVLILPCRWGPFLRRRGTRQDDEAGALLATCPVDPGRVSFFIKLFSLPFLMDQLGSPWISISPVVGIIQERGCRS